MPLPTGGAVSPPFSVLVSLPVQAASRVTAAISGGARGRKKFILIFSVKAERNRRGQRRAARPSDELVGEGGSKGDGSASE